MRHNWKIRKESKRNKMEEKNKREKGTRASGKATAEACGEESRCTPSKKRKMEGQSETEREGEVDEVKGFSVDEFRAGVASMRKVMAMVARFGEPDMNGPTAKDGGAAENGRSILWLLIGREGEALYRVVRDVVGW